MKIIRKLITLRLLWKLHKLIDPKKLVGLNDILEKVYPGIKAEIQELVEKGDIRIMSKTLQYINTHGGAQKMADYYKDADQNGKDEMLAAFNKAFKPGAPFEDAVLTLDGIAKVKDMGVNTQLFGDVKDSIVMTSIQLNYRTIDDWRTFVRRQHEANKDVLLGILDEIQDDNVNTTPKEAEEGNSEQPDGKQDEVAEYDFSMSLLSKLYEYDEKVFKHLPSEYEFASIIMRKQHERKLAECQGKKVLMYHIIERLSRLLPEDKRKDWKEDIAEECGYDSTTISKKFNDTTNMKPENLKLFEKLDCLFDKFDTLK